MNLKKPKWSYELEQWEPADTKHSPQYMRAVYLINLRKYSNVRLELERNPYSAPDRQVEIRMQARHDPKFRDAFDAYEAKQKFLMDLIDFLIEENLFMPRISN